MPTYKCLGHQKLMNYSLNSRWGHLNPSMSQAYIAQINCNMRDEWGHFSIFLQLFTEYIATV